MTNQEKIELASNVNTPLGVLEKLSNDRIVDVRKAIASNKSTPEHILIRLSKDKNNDVLRKLVCNPNIPLVVIESLSNSKCEDVRASLAYNENTPLNILEKFVKDKVYVIDCLIDNKNCPEHILKILSKYRFFSIRAKVVKHPNCSISLLESILSKGRDEALKRIVLEHPKIINKKLDIFKTELLSNDEFERMAKSSNVILKTNLAQNENCPNSVLQLLSNDNDVNVSSCAINNKNYINIDSSSFEF